METATGRGAKKAGFRALFFTGLVFLVIGFTSNKIIGFFLEEMEGARNWIETTGTVERSGVYESGKSDSGKPMYSLDVLVSYEVEGHMYSTSQMDPSGGSTSTSSRRMVQKKAEAYPEGLKVPVYYNPEYPEQAVLDREIPLWLKILFKLPLGGIIVGILLILQGILRLAGLGLALGFLVHSSKKEKHVSSREAGQNPVPPRQSFPRGSARQNSPEQEGLHTTGTETAPPDKQKGEHGSEDDGFSI